MVAWYQLFFVIQLWLACIRPESALLKISLFLNLLACFLDFLLFLSKLFLIKTYKCRGLIEGADFMVVLRQHFRFESTPFNFFSALLLSFSLQLLLFSLLFLHQYFDPSYRVYGKILGWPTVNFSDNFRLKMRHLVELRTEWVNFWFEGTLCHFDHFTCPFFNARHTYQTSLVA